MKKRIYPLNLTEEIVKKLWFYQYEFDEDRKKIFETLLNKYVFAILGRNTFSSDEVEVTLLDEFLLVTTIFGNTILFDLRKCGVIISQYEGITFSIQVKHSFIESELQDHLERKIWKVTANEYSYKKYREEEVLFSGVLRSIGVHLKEKEYFYCESQMEKEESSLLKTWWRQICGKDLVLLSTHFSANTYYETIFQYLEEASLKKFHEKQLKKNG